MQSLPENLRGVPPQTLFPMLLDQLIDGRALVAEARKTGLDKDPDVQRQLEAAEDRALQTAMLSKQVGPSIMEAALRAKSNHVHALHLAGSPRCTGFGIYRGADRAHVAGNIYRAKSAAHFVPAHEFDAGCLQHCVRRLHQGNQALGLDHSNRFIRHVRSPDFQLLQHAFDQRVMRTRDHVRRHQLADHLGGC